MSGEDTVTIVPVGNPPGCAAVFPQVYFALVNTGEVGLCTMLTDKQMAEGVEAVMKNAVSRLMDVSRWEKTRDAPARGFRFYAWHRFLKVPVGVVQIILEP